MSETTNLKLFKHDNPPTNENQFDVENALNKNWDKIDESYGEIKENILTLQENDTEIKEDIEEIQENISNIQDKNIEQDNKLTDLEQENKNIKSALINVETEQAKSIHVDNASTVSAKLEVEGNAEQETRSGKNLFDKNNVNSIKAECNISIMKLTTSNQNSYYMECDPNTTYTISKTIGTFNRVWSMAEIPAVNETVTVTNSDTSNNVATITTGENDKYLCFYPLLSSEVASGITYESVLDTVQIEKGLSATEYETYGAMPSPDFPSKIKCLGSNKNELNIEEIESNSNTNVINNQNGILELQGIEGYYKGVYIEKQLKPKTTYTICANLTEVSNNAKGRIGIGTEVSYNNASIATLDFDVATGKKEINFTTNETGIVYIMFVCNWAGNSGHVKYENIKLEEGTVATSYSPYGQGSTEIKKYNKNIASNIKYFSSKNKYAKLVDASYFFVKDKYYKISFDTPNSGIKIYLQAQGDNVNYSTEKYQICTCDGKRHSFTVKARETKSTNVTWGLLLRETDTNDVESGLLSNLMIEEVQSSSADATEYEEHQEESYILPIQQEMLNGDYFELEEDGWKEVHGYVNKKLNSTDSWSLVNSSENSFKFRLETYLKFSDYNEKCTHFKTGKSYWNTDEEGCYMGTDNRLVISIPKNNDYNVTNLETFKTLLSTIDATLYYYNTTLTKLPCTEEQSAVLNELNNLDLFRPTTNIITTEDIALLKLNYVADTKTYVDNKYNNLANQILEIVGGN